MPSCSGNHRRTRSNRSLAAAALAHHQPFLAIEPVELLVVQHDTLPLQQQMAGADSRTAVALKPVPAAASGSAHLSLDKEMLQDVIR
jgi:hypothetical protein